MKHDRIILWVDMTLEHHVVHVIHVLNFHTNNIPR